MTWVLHGITVAQSGGWRSSQLFQLGEMPSEKTIQLSQTKGVYAFNVLMF